MDFFARLWRGEEGIASAIAYLLLIPLGIIYGISEVCFNLKNQYEFPAVAVYFWYIIITIYIVFALVMVIKSSSYIRDAQFRAVMMLILIFCAIPLVALPISRIYSSYAVFEMARLKTILDLKEAQAQKIREKARENDSAQMKAELDKIFMDVEYQQAVARYQQLKFSRENR